MSGYGYTKRVAYCKCGSEIEVKSHFDVTNKAIDIFWQVHQGEGHGRATQQQAARAREAWDDEQWAGTPARRAHADTDASHEAQVP